MTISSRGTSADQYATISRTGRTPFAESRRPGRAVQHQRNQLAREPVHRLPIRPAHADAHLHFRRIGIRRRRRTVARIHAEKLRVDLSNRRPSAASRCRTIRSAARAFSIACGHEYTSVPIAFHPLA